MARADSENTTFYLGDLHDALGPALSLTHAIVLAAEGLDGADGNAMLKLAGDCEDILIEVRGTIDKKVRKDGRLFSSPEDPAVPSATPAKTKTMMERLEEIEAATTANPPTAFGLVTEMEDDVTATRHLVGAVACIAETLSDEHDLILQRLAWTILSHVEAIEDRRGKLFELLHPNREHFERVGWPGEDGEDKPAETAAA